MKIECPEKYSLQMTTYGSVFRYSLEKGISFRRASFLVFSVLKGSGLNCGFNLKSCFQFYSSLKYFKHSKTNHPKVPLSHVRSGFSGVRDIINYVLWINYLFIFLKCTPRFVEKF
jgi:hypothetical protein